MRLLLFFVLNILLSLALELFLPWWSIAISSAIVGMILFPKYAAMLIISFVSIFIYWGSVAFYLSFQNQHLLLQKMAHLWVFEDFTFMPIMITGCVGGLVSVAGSSLGYWLRYAYAVPPKKSNPTL